MEAFRNKNEYSHGPNFERLRDHVLELNDAELAYKFLLYAFKEVGLVNRQAFIHVICDGNENEEGRYAYMLLSRNLSEILSDSEKETCLERVLRSSDTQVLGMTRDICKRIGMQGYCEALERAFDAKLNSR